MLASEGARHCEDREVEITKTLASRNKDRRLLKKKAKLVRRGAATEEPSEEKIAW